MRGHVKYMLCTGLTGLVLGSSVAVASGLTSGATNNVKVAPVAAPLARATRLRQGDVVRGELSSFQPIHVVVALKLRNPEQLDHLIATKRTLTSSQFNSNHAPTQDQARSVANYLSIMGFKNIVIASNLLLVSADGTADSARAAFSTRFARVQTKEGREAFANNGDARVPVLLRDTVLSVIGLQTVHQAHTFARLLPPQAIAATPNITGHNPMEFSSIYGGAGIITAAGVTVGIITDGYLDTVRDDLNTFTANNGLPTVVTQTVDTNGTSFDFNAIEWALDSQSIVGMGGGHVGKLIFYNMPSLANTDMIANFNTVVTANAAKIINVSLGECETWARDDGSAAAADQLFKRAVAQGQTFAIATGDSGADECRNGGITPSWPASSPYVVAVAGTLLSASATTWVREVVWNGSGGSPSTFEPKPTWQNAMVPGTKRGVADVAFDASPYSGAKIVYLGAPAQIGGTSLAAPIFAGMWARIIAVKGSAVGFAAPLLYQLPATDFHDIIAGNNNGETATVGYDFASGRGSMILNRALLHIPSNTSNAAPVANFGFSVFGLVARFSDASTDSDGTIAAHAWSFGDGSSSTAANPGHIYAKAGAYIVTESVVDNGGASSNKARSVAVGSH